MPVTCLSPSTRDRHKPTMVILFMRKQICELYFTDNIIILLLLCTLNIYGVQRSSNKLLVKFIMYLITTMKSGDSAFQLWYQALKLLITPPPPAHD